MRLKGMQRADASPYSYLLGYQRGTARQKRFIEDEVELSAKCLVLATVLGLVGVLQLAFTMEKRVGLVAIHCCDKPNKMPSHSPFPDSPRAALPTKQRTFTPDLPPELWRPIFIDATSIAPSSDAGINVMESRETQQRDMECSLGLVCKLWRAIVLPLLYESVWIHEPRMARRFLRTLADSASTGASSQAGYGQWIRSLVLPERNRASGWENFHIADILNHCTDIRVVAKLGHVMPDFWHGIACTTSCPTCPTLGSFTSLRHIFWACSFDPEVVAIDAQRLITLIEHAPNLATLHILNMGQSSYSIELPSSNQLASLTTLEYQSFMSNTTLTIRHADMPNLSHVIAEPASLRFPDPHNENVDAVLAEFGKQLRAFELPDIMVINGTATPDLHSIFHHCPNLRTFGYNLLSTVLPSDNRVLHPSLSVVALKVPASHSTDDEAVKRCLETNVKKITGGLFPALRRVELEVRGPPSKRLHRDLCERFHVEDGRDSVVIWGS